MTEKSMTDRSPVRVFERAISGGLGAGNLGVVLSRPGVGKTAFLVGLAVDHLLQGKKVLYISTKESVEHINDFFEQIFHAMAEALDLDEVPRRQLRMERNRHIHVYNAENFSLEKLDRAVGFLDDAMGFTPATVIMDGTPRYANSEQWELDGLRGLAAKWGAEVWTSANTHREGQETDSRGVPADVARFDASLDVLVSLVPEKDHVKLKFIKDHDRTEIPAVQLEVDPRTMLLRWR